jgi:hypothetical protein
MVVESTVLREIENEESKKEAATALLNYPVF